MITLITIPSNFIASTTDVVSQLWTDFSAPLTLIIGTMLLVTVVVIFISSLRHH